MSILSPHVINGSSDAIRLIREGKAPAVKLIGSYDKAGEYKAAGARFVLGRVPMPDDLWRNYETDPVRFYFEFLHGQITHPANQGVDAWECGINESYRKQDGTETPDYTDVERKAAFESVIARRVHAAGKIPVIGNWSVGTPSGTLDEQRRAWRVYQPALRTVAELGGLMALHCYSSVAGWENPLLTLRDALNADNNRIGIVITECGNEPGYREPGKEIDPSTYAQNMIAFDRYLMVRYGSRVRYAFMFSYGDGWENYNLQGDDTFNNAIIAYGNSSATPPPPPPPPAPKKFVKVISDYLNVRDGPGVTYNHVGVLGKGSRLPVLEISPVNKWVRISDKYWISGSPAYVVVE